MKNLLFASILLLAPAAPAHGMPILSGADIAGCSFAGANDGMSGGDPSVRHGVLVAPPVLLDPVAHESGQLTCWAIYQPTTDGTPVWPYRSGPRTRGAVALVDVNTILAGSGLTPYLCTRLDVWDHAGVQSAYVRDQDGDPSNGIQCLPLTERDLG
jgi:hypothetical protein